MAHAYVASIEEELTCCVCFELFIDPHTPKELRCPHVICELCLNHLVKDSAIDCPQCRAITRVSKDGVAALRTNLGIRNLAEKHQKHLQNQEHQSQPSSQSRSQNDQVAVCLEHGEKMHFYCVTCNVLVCRACTVVIHLRPQHQIQDVKVLRREKMKLSDATINKLEQDILLCEKKSREISATEQRILSSIKAEEEKIDQAVALLMEKACEQSDTLKAEIRRKNDPKLRLCQERKGSLQKQAHSLRSIVTDTKAVVEESSSHDFIMRHNTLMDKIKAIPDHSDEGLVQYQPGEVEFKPEQLKLGAITVRQSNQSAVEEINTEGLSWNRGTQPRYNLPLPPPPARMRKGPCPPDNLPPPPPPASRGPPPPVHYTRMPPPVQHPMGPGLRPPPPPPPPGRTRWIPPPSLAMNRPPRTRNRPPPPHGSTRCIPPPPPPPSRYRPPPSCEV